MRLRRILASRNTGNRPPTSVNNARGNNTTSKHQNAYTSPIQQRSTSAQVGSETLTAGSASTIFPSEAVDRNSQDTFLHLLDLPAELREQVYLFAIQPITPLDTAAIPGTPNRVRLPPIAQVSRQLRDEVRYVLFRNRLVEISLHSGENLRRALLWAENLSGPSSLFGIIIMSGCMKQAMNEFFHITIEISDGAPFFRVRTRPGASQEADLIISRMKSQLLDWLEAKVKAAKEGPKARLSSASIIEMIYMIDGASCYYPPADPTSS